MMVDAILDAVERAKIAKSATDLPYETILDALIGDIEQVLSCDAPPPSDSVEIAIEAVASAFSVLPQHILGQRRTRRYAQARHALVYVLRAKRFTWPRIAGFVGRNYGTVRHAFRAAESLRDYDENFRKRLAHVCGTLHIDEPEKARAA